MASITLVVKDDDFLAELDKEFDVVVQTGACISSKDETGLRIIDSRDKIEIRCMVRNIYNRNHTTINR